MSVHVIKEAMKKTVVEVGDRYSTVYSLLLKQIHQKKRKKFDAKIVCCMPRKVGTFLMQNEVDATRKASQKIDATINDAEV